MSLRSRIIPLVLRLQYPPFVWLFRAYYWMAVQASRSWVGRIEGVRSMYLSGSLVRREVVLGLSDIDFKLFVTGGKNQECYRAIRRRFSQLRRLFPMLGPPDEKGIYFLESFAADYRHHPLVQHLFDERFFRHRLLRGEDLWGDLPVEPWDKLDPVECTHARLKDWIERIHLLADCDTLCRPQKQHLFFKAISDVALLTLRLDFPEFTFGHRAEILETVSRQFEERDRGPMENLIRENRANYRIQCNSMDENLRLFKKLVAHCAQRASGLKGGGEPSLEVDIQPAPPEEDKLGAASVLRAASPKIMDIRACRWPHLPLNPFDLNLFGIPVYLVECSEPLGTEEIHRLKAYYRGQLRNRAIVLLREHAEYLSALDAELVDHWGAFPGSSDLLCLLLGVQSRHEMKERQKTSVLVRIRSFQEQLEAALADPEFGRMDLLVFPRFLFNAMRVLIFGAGLRRGRWQLLFTPVQIADFLVRETPLLPSFPRRLAEEYDRAARHEGGIDERLLPKCRFLLAEMLEVSRNGCSWEPLQKLNEMPDERYLTISAAVITANRPLQLDRCLRSLAQLARPPEELIVVESGSGSHARRTIENLQSPFPVRFLHIYGQGVSAARNLAVRTARGEIVAFLDDDATVEPDWLERLERVFLRDPKVGLAGGAILNMDCGRKDWVWRFMETVEKV